MTYQTPCSKNPEDWFLNRDGKQYSDDDLVSEEQVMAHLDEVDPNGTRSVAQIEEAWESLEADAVKDALRRRRHARDACHTECYLRLQCLDMALTHGYEHGTWGGYTEEQLRELRKEMARRARVKQKTTE